MHFVSSYKQLTLVFGHSQRHHAHAVYYQRTLLMVRVLSTRCDRETIGRDKIAIVDRH